MPFKEITLRILLLLLLIGNSGCSIIFSSQTSAEDWEFHNIPVMSDEIVAIGYPDGDLTKLMGNNRAIAFIGRKNIYMLYSGGEELNQISHLKLDMKKMEIDSQKNIYVKERQVWGELKVIYHLDGLVSNDELEELKLGGFVKTGTDEYSTFIAIEGVIYPTLKIPESQHAKLAMQRTINFYNPREAAPPLMAKVIKIPMTATKAIMQAVLFPIYIAVELVCDTHCIE